MVDHVEGEKPFGIVGPHATVTGRDAGVGCEVVTQPDKGLPDQVRAHAKATDVGIVAAEEAPAQLGLAAQADDGIPQVSSTEL